MAPFMSAKIDIGQVGWQSTSVHDVGKCRRKTQTVVGVVSDKLSYAHDADRLSRRCGWQVRQMNRLAVLVCLADDQAAS